MNNGFVMDQYEPELNNRKNFLKENIRIFVSIGLIIIILTTVAIIVYKTMNKPPHYTYSIEKVEPQVAFIGKESSFNINIVGDEKDKDRIETEAYIVDDDIIELKDSSFYGESGTISYTPIGTGKITIYVVSNIYDENGTSAVEIGEIEVPVTVY